MNRESACGARYAMRIAIAVGTVAAVGGLLGAGFPSPNSSSVPNVRSARTGASRVAASTRQFYVASNGSKYGPCSRTKPCRTVDHAVSLANHIPYLQERVKISVGKGTFVTHLNFPDQPYPETSVTIVGLGPGMTKLSAEGAGMVLFALADAPMIDIQNATISGGTGMNGVGGGAVHDGGNVMNFFHVTFSNNTDPTLPSSGGAVFDDAGTMTITDSTISGNAAGSAASMGVGGGIAEQGGSLTITNSLIAGNAVEKAGIGGGVYVNDGHLTIDNSTLTANSAPGTGTGGAIGLDQVAHAVVVGSTVNGNSSGGHGGLVASTGGAKISFGGDILVADAGVAGSACAGGGVFDLGYNIYDQAGCSMGGKSSQKTAGSVGLLHPASNGGFTQTERILKTSTAHDAIPRSVKLAGSSYCGGHDQRGVPRQQGSASHCDAGAYQFAPPVITGISPARGVPGTEVAIRGYGYDFLSLRFGNASPGFSVRNDVRITVATPKLGKGQYVISITNPDGKTSTKFQVLKPPKH